MVVRLTFAGSLEVTELGNCEDLPPCAPCLVVAMPGDFQGVRFVWSALLARAWEESLLPWALFGQGTRMRVTSGTEYLRLSCI